MIIATNALGMETIITMTITMTNTMTKTQMNISVPVMIAPTMIVTEKMDGGEMTYKNKIAINEWIPVNERPPEECKEVLVTVKDDSADSPIYYTAVGWYYAGIWVVEDAVCHQVIAWMRPPKPYKEDAE